MPQSPDHDPALCGIVQDQNGMGGIIGSNFGAILYDLKEHSIKNSFVGDFPNTTTTNLKNGAIY
jgi:hypothetical protein